MPRYNIAPCHGPGFEAPILVTGRELSLARFWYIPAFWNGPLKGLPTSFNARSETAFQKKYFSGAQRCLIPTTGWREFPGPAGKKRAQQFECRPSDDANVSYDAPLFFAFGGLTSEWKDPATGEMVRSFAILTTEPSDAVRPYHDRMPLLVHPEAYESWLSPRLSVEEVLPQALLWSSAAPLFTYECSTFGNNTRNEGPVCIAPIKKQGLLFE